MSAKNERITIKDVLLLTLVYLGLLSLLVLLPEDSPFVNVCVLAGYALIGFVAIGRTKSGSTQRK